LQQFLVMEPCVTGWLATAYIETGDPQKAREIAAHSVDSELYKHGGRYTWVFVHNALAEALLACGDAAQAIATGETALAMAQSSNEPIQIAQALFVLGRIRARTGALEQAVADLRAALALAEAHSLDPLARDCRRALAEFASR
jgi:tetratricopeptide (TPR) repeat protein